MKKNVTDAAYDEAAVEENKKGKQAIMQESKVQILMLCLVKKNSKCSLWFHINNMAPRNQILRCHLHYNISFLA